MAKKIRLGFLASHGGSNVQAIVDACQQGRLEAEPRIVISNNSRSGVLQRARREAIPALHLSRKTHPESAELDGAILTALQQHRVQVVCLAGYMKLLGQATLAAYAGRILNIHPALLPKFGGKGFFGEAVHRSVLEAGERETGVTVHLVDEEYDHGRVLAQKKVPVLAGDTEKSLAARVLEQEHSLYAETLQQIAQGAIRLDGLDMQG